MESVSKLVNATRQNNALTVNGAVTHSTSLNNVVDLFFLAGASRSIEENQIRTLLEKSWAEDAELTLKLIFWAGDIRQGIGERRFFRIALSWLQSVDEEALKSIVCFVPEYNRWDSLFHLKFKNIRHVISDAMAVNSPLLGKWLPRRKQHNNLKAKIMRMLGLSPKQYRNKIVKMSNTVEQKLCAKDFGNINYEQVPSVAMAKYTQTFFKHDDFRFSAYIMDVEHGKAKINAEAVFPYQLLEAWKEHHKDEVLEAQWKALPDWCVNDKKILPVCDVSGSMTGLPMAISVSLGVYLSERNKGIFKDAFITFSEKPEMQYLKGTVASRMRQLEQSEWGMDTNLNAVFDLILDAASDTVLSPKTVADIVIAEANKEHEENGVVPDYNDMVQTYEEAVFESVLNVVSPTTVVPEDMPDTILIISDMEFNECGTLTNYDAIKQKYEDAGFKIPNIIFWNVYGRVGNVPVKYDTPNVGLVSGASPSVIKSVMSGSMASPVSIMLDVLENERYADICCHHLV